ncbi:ATP-binding protein [Paenibacillus taiwanensis]|uniref:ATP-binding protein n=1 Tax=Paenibacillus taiwanensis TaxID=401638 RepID=UPI001B7F9F22|nr:ATP-binding protein [Paenibacillus taiwanensis]
MVYKDESNQYVVSEVTPFDKADEYGIKRGEVVLEVDGMPPSNNLFVTKFGNIEQVDSLLVRKLDGTVEAIQIDHDWLANMRSGTLFFHILVPSLVLVVFLLMSCVVYAKRKDDKAARLLILFFVCIGIIYFSSPVSGKLDLVARVLISLLPLGFCLFMYFMNAYLSRYRIKFVNNYILHLLSIIVLLQCVAKMLFHIDIIKADISGTISAMYYSTIVFANVVCLYRLIALFIQYRFTKLNPLFKFMLAAHSLAFVPFVTMNVISLSLFRVQLLPAYFTTLFVLVLPISYMYLITSNRLFDIDFILTRFKYYTSLALVPSLLVLFFLAIIYNANYDHTWVQWFQIFVVIHIGFTLFLYLKEQVDYKFRPKLFKQMYSYQDSLDRFSRSMARVMKKEDLIRAIEQEVTSMLPLSRFQFLTVNSSHARVNPSPTNDVDHDIAKYLLANVESLQVAEVITMPQGVALIVGQRKEEIHVIWIGNKSNRTLFNVDELRWLKTIANYTSIVYENLHFLDNFMEQLEDEMRQTQSSTSPWLLRLLFLLSENERRRLGSDLHDSALQDQLIWYRRLETFMADNKIPKHMQNELYQIKEGLLDVIHQIRETCNELRPPLLTELGVVEAVEFLTDHLQLQVNFAVVLQAKPVTATLSEEQITAVYRIMQELLRNTEKHAKANKVVIDIEEDDTHIYLAYKDDGVGMNLDNLQSSFSHMGLSGIRERVISLEGEIEFHAEEGRGFAVSMKIPIKLSK